MKKVVFSLLLGLLAGAAHAQSGCPTIITGAVLTAAQWNACFGAKQDALGFVPLNRAGDTMLGRLNIAPSTITSAGFRLNPGVAPTTPTNGDVWITVSGIYVQAGNVTMQLAPSSSPIITTPTITGGTINNTVIGGTTPAAGSFTSLGVSGALSGAAGTFTALTSSQQFVLTGRTDSTISADQNNWTPTGTGTYSQSSVVFVDGGVADRNITGLTGGTAGRFVWLTNKGTTNSIVLKNRSGSSSAANQFLLPSDVQLPANTSIGLRYDGTANVWRPEGRALANTGVTAGTYGSNTLVGQFTVGADGRITSASNASISALALNLKPGGRLTVTSGTPVIIVTAPTTTTLYYDCYQGSNTVPYYNGSADSADTIPACEVSTAMAPSGTGLLNGNDVFDVWWDGVHHNICVATNGSGGGWGSDTGGSNTGRGTGYSQLDTTTRPYITNKTALANCYNGTTNYGSLAANRATYLGTIYTSAAGQVSFTYGAAGANGTAGLYGVWNAYNRVNVGCNVSDTGGTYTYSSATVRQAHGSAGMQCKFVVGLVEDAINVSYSQQVAFAAAAGATTFIGTGLDTTSAFDFRNYQVAWNTNALSSGIAVSGVYSPSGLSSNYTAGVHTISANEGGEGTNSNTLGGTVSASNALSASLRM